MPHTVDTTINQHVDASAADGEVLKKQKKLHNTAKTRTFAKFKAREHNVKQQENKNIDYKRTATRQGACQQKTT